MAEALEGLCIQIGWYTAGLLAFNAAALLGACRSVSTQAQAVYAGTGSETGWYMYQ